MPFEDLDDKNQQQDDLLICATFGQFNGQPVSILASATTVDGQRFLIIAGEEKPTYKAKDGYLNITDLKAFEADAIFLQENFIAALEAYRQIKASNQLIYDDSVIKHDVGDSIQIDGLKDSGKFNYDMQDITNGHAAILAICYYFAKNQDTDSCIEFSEDLIDFYTTI